MCSRRSASIRWKCIGWIGSRRSFSLRECATTPRVRGGRASAFLGMERGLDDRGFARLRLLIGSLFLGPLFVPLLPGLLRCLTCADWAPSNMVGANADGDRGLVYACQQSQRTAQAELVADLEGDRTAVQVRPVDGFAAPLARRGLQHAAA